MGIVASVIWAVGAPIYWDSAARRDVLELFWRSYERCRDDPRNDLNRCFEDASKLSQIVPRYRPGPPEERINFAAVAFPPIVLGWLIAYALVYLVRWIQAGVATR
jgi:hypothetical protein